MSAKIGEPPLRFVKVLIEQLAELSFAELARRILEANGNDPRRRIDRRKLRKLVDGEDVPLSTRELAALDAYLTTLGESLADKPLFEKPDPIRSLADKGCVAFVLGSYPRDKVQRNDVSRWDVRAMANLLGGLQQRRPGTKVDIQDVLFQEELPRSLPVLAAPGPSVCGIGSPRACYASELMLAAMLGVKPFNPDLAENVPIRFVWTGSAPCPYPSSFRVGADRIRDLDAPLARHILDGKLWGALQIGDTVYPDWHREGDDKWTSHSMAMVQERPAGKVWMVIAGLSGPDTDAAAIAVVEGLTGAVPPTRHGRSPVGWDVVESTVVRRKGGHGDAREVVAQRVVAHGEFA